MHLGLSLHTGECTENTAEYLYTKPCGRQMIFKGKMLCALVGVCVTGISYLLASFLTMMLFRPGFPVGEFLLVVGSFVLLTLFFALLGLMVGIFHPNNRSPLLTAGLVVFVEYCITSFSRTVSIRAIGFLSPFSFSVRQKFTMQGLILGTICSGICSCCLLLSFWLTRKS